MRSVCLTHKLLDSLVFQFNMPLSLYPFADASDGYVRSITVAEAAPGVTWQQIVAEALEKEHSEDQVLASATYVHHIYILSLTAKRFLKIAERLPRRLNSPRKTNIELYEDLAKELIANRDYELAGGYFANRPGFKHEKLDYWPKD